MRIRWFLSLCVACAAAASVAAAKLPPLRSEQVQGHLRIEVVDLTPRFLAFYESARNERDPDARFALWQEHYGFAAVPPGPRGREMARRLLTEAWPKYEANLSIIRRGAAVFGDEPIRTLRKVAQLLNVEDPVRVRLVAYVGAFDNNAFAANDEGVPTVSFPVEMPANQRRVTLAHELSHAVHMQTAGLSGGWERSIAATMIQEGLAMHVAREVAPGRPLADYVEHTPGWWNQVQPKRRFILRALLPVLDKSDSDIVFRFTIGPGPNGLEREAYAAGWWVIEHLRRRGMSLAEIARVPEAKMPQLVRRAICEMGLEN